MISTLIRNIKRTNAKVKDTEEAQEWFTSAEIAGYQRTK